MASVLLPHLSNGVTSCTAKLCKQLEKLVHETKNKKTRLKNRKRRKEKVTLCTKVSSLLSPVTDFFPQSSSISICFQALRQTNTHLMVGVCRQMEKLILARCEFFFVFSCIFKFFFFIFCYLFSVACCECRTVSLICFEVGVGLD